jgi:GNAT superfamily N-acetyltransferase
MERFIETARTLDPGGRAEGLSVAGGIAVFLETASPVNHAIGLGMRGEVAAHDIEAVERFYRTRQSQPLVSVCPLAHPSLFAALGARGWVIDGFEHVLYAEIEPTAAAHATAADGIEIREAITDEQRDGWRVLVATGFCAPLPPLDEQLTLGSIVTHRPGARLYTAYVEGQVAGGGELFVEGDVAWLSADATLPRFRCRGVQSALQRHRVAEAARKGCRLVVSEAHPGSASQRNMERLGLRIAYTRADLVSRTGVQGV